MKKIGFVVGEFPLLSETFVTSQIVGLRDRGFDVSIICDKVAAPKGIDHGAEPYRSLLQNTQTRWVANGITHPLVNRLQGRWHHRAQTALDAFCDARLNRFDVLIAHFGWNGNRLARSKAFGKFNRPFMTVFHGFDVSVPHFENDMKRYVRLYQGNDIALPVCHHFRDILVEAGMKPENAIVHRMGVDCASIRFETPARPEGGLRFISVARLVEKKGIAYALSALGLLYRRRPELAWHYDVIGDGPLTSALQEAAEKEGIRHRVHFHGPLPHEEVKRKLRDAQAFVLSSVTAASGDKEGVPVAIMEAMASGLPVVSTFHSGIPELVADGVSGLLAPERDAETLSRHLEWVADNPQGCEIIARSARASVEQNFNQKTLNDALAERVNRVADAYPRQKG